MTREEASEILELSPHATPAERAAQHEALRRQLEEKLARAPTAGLREKYRAGLRQLEEAAGVLAAAEGGADLPVLKRAAGDRRPEAGGPGPSPSAAHPAPVPRRKTGSEFVVVALIAIAVLGAGGWWVLKVRADNAEQARITAEAKLAAETRAAADRAEQERRAEEARRAAEAKRQDEEAEKARVAAAAKAEQVRLEQLSLRLRPRLSELNIALDAALKVETRAERELDELKAEERVLEREARGGVTPDLRAVRSLLQVHDRFVTWLRDHLAAHPARLARARLEELAAAKAWDECAAGIDAYAQAIGALQESIAAQRKELFAITGALEVSAEPAEVEFTFKDAYGRTRTARTPATLEEVPVGAATVTFQREGWPALARTAVVKPGATSAVTADLVGGRLELASKPFAVDITVEGQGRTERGRTPATFAELPVGKYRVTYARAGWPGQTATVEVTRGGKAAHEADFPAGGTLKVESQPAGASVTLGGKVVGTTPLELGDQPAGPVQVELALADYRPVTLKGNIEFGKATALSTSLRSAALTPEEAFEKFSREADGTWVHHGKNGLGGSATFYLRFVKGSRTLSFEQTGFGGSVRTMTMVDYDAVNRDVLITFGGLNALNGKLRIRLDGDTVLFGRDLQRDPMTFHRQ